MRPALLVLALALGGCAAGESDDTASNGTGAATGTGGSGGGGFVDSGFPTGGTAGESSGGSAGTPAQGGSAGSCAHPPVNDPSADDSDLEPGPIVKFTVIVYYIKRGPNDEIITPTQVNGKWTALVGDKIVFDSTQKNANNKPCQWENEPEYIISDSCAFQRLATGNPFLLQMQANAPGELTVSASIDGITANEVTVVAE
jgi:hypothetical protein